MPTDAYTVELVIAGDPLDIVIAVEAMPRENVSSWLRDLAYRIDRGVTSSGGVERIQLRRLSIVPAGAEPAREVLRAGAEMTTSLMDDHGEEHLKGLVSELAYTGADDVLIDWRGRAYAALGEKVPDAG